MAGLRSACKDPNAYIFPSEKRKEHGFYVVIPYLIAVIRFIIFAATLNGTAQHVAGFLYAAEYMSSNAVVFTWAWGSLG
ncbi:hypothetical protein GGR55DRAFT_673410 [Xylaria sp. FL0064]|nr:hypothetical protein GGR55DRAFT_673410 [Xylaria sp. FL0064]